MAATRPGLKEGLQLLNLSAPLDSTRINPGPLEFDGVVLVAFLVRARRLTRAVFHLLGEGLDAEASILNRALMETVVTLMWMSVDWRSRVARWRLSDAVRRLSWDAEYTAAQDGTETLLDSETRAQLETIREKLEAAGVKQMPSLRQQCDAIEPTWHALAYIQLSHGATHATPYAMEKFIVAQTAEGTSFSAYGPRTRDETEPYETAALWLEMALDVACQMAPGAFPWTRVELEPIEKALFARFEEPPPET